MRARRSPGSSPVAGSGWVGGRPLCLNPCRTSRLDDGADDALPLWAVNSQCYRRADAGLFVPLPGLPAPPGSIAHWGTRWRKAQVTFGGPANIYTRTGDSGFEIRCHFCSNCGTTVIADGDRLPELCVIAAGCFAGLDLPAAYRFDLGRVHALVARRSICCPICLRASRAGLSRCYPQSEPPYTGIARCARPIRAGSALGRQFRAKTSPDRKSRRPSAIFVS